jgi:glycosyltransferase involved in cell wall biosynthesis
MSDKQKVLYFSRDFTTHDQRFLTSLSETDYEVAYLRLENKLKQKAKEVLPDTINILPTLNQNSFFGYPKTLNNLNKLKKIIQEFKPDLIHAGPVQSCAFLTALSEFSPLVTMSWGSDILVDSEKNLLNKWITKFTLRKTNHFLGDCETVKKKAMQFGLSQEKITTFPWGIDLDKFKSENNTDLRNQLGWQNNFIILSLRSWEEIYGVDLVVKAFIDLSMQFPEIRLLLLGDGSQREMIHQIVADAKVTDKVHFGGVIDQKDLPKYYQTADLYLSASYSDGSSVSLMEALASALPTLVSDIPSNQEWIKEGENGWLFKVGDVEDLKRKIIDIVNQREKITDIRKQARQTAEKKADWTLNFQKLMNAYQRALTV